MGSLPRSLFTHLLEFYRSPPRMVCSAHPTDRTRKPRTYGGGTVGKLVVAIRRSLLQGLVCRSRRELVSRSIDSTPPKHKGWCALRTLQLLDRDLEIAPTGVVG